MLTAAERNALKAKAHKLYPVVEIRALSAHELIKVRAATLDRDQRDEAFSSICERTKAEQVQQVGKVFVLFRKKPDE
jgi:RNA-binding protein